MLRRFLLAAVLILVLAGCSRDQRILERVGYIETAAFDAAPDNKIKATVSIPLVSQYARDGKTTDELLDTIASSPKQAREALSLRTSRISIRTSMVVGEGDAGKIISQEYPRHTKTANYINKLLQKEFLKQSLPRTSLYEFTRNYFDDGEDPIAVLVIEQKRDITVSGIALMRDDRMIAKLPWEDVYLFMLLYSNLQEGEFTLTTEHPDLKAISVKAVKSKRRIVITKSTSGEYEANIYLKIYGSVDEYIGNAKLSTSERAKVEKLVSEHIVSEALRVIKTMQRHRTDGIGLGKYVRNSMSYDEWKKTDWHEMFSQLPVKVHCSFYIKQFGSYFD